MSFRTENAVKKSVERRMAGMPGEGMVAAPKSAAVVSSTTHPSDSALAQFIGARIRAIRSAQGVDLASLATSIGITETEMQLMESGHLRIPPSVIVRISVQLNANIGAFFEDKKAAMPPLGRAPPEAAPGPGAFFAMASGDMRVRLLMAFSNLSDVRQQEIIVRLLEAMNAAGSPAPR